METHTRGTTRHIPQCVDTCTRGSTSRAPSVPRAGSEEPTAINPPWASHLADPYTSPPRQQRHVYNDELAPAFGSAITARDGPASHLVRRYFSKVITDSTGELPIAVIKELKTGFKNYIPLSLCTHKACSNATRSMDAFDTEIGMNERGEIRLKQRTLTAARDHYLTTNDFTEIRENFIREMMKYLVLGGDLEPGALRALDCVDMF